MFKSIRSTIIIFFTSILILSNLIIGYYVINQLTNSLQFEATKGLNQVVEETSKLIYSRVQAEKTFMEEVSENQILLNETPWEEKVKYLEEKAKKKGYMVFAYINMDGDIVRYDTEKSKGNARGREYFAEAKRGSAAISDIIISSVTGEPIIVIAAPIIREGKIVGVLNGVRPQTGLNKIIEDFQYGKTGKAFILNSHGQVMAHSDKAYVQNQVNYIELIAKDNKVKSDFLKSAVELNQNGITTVVENGKKELIITKKIENTNWTIVSTVELNDIFQDVSKMLKIMIYIFGMTFIGGWVLAYLGTRRITEPLGEITERIDEISKGNLSIGLDSKFLKKHNEIGKLSHSFEIMRIKLKESFEQIQFMNSELEKKVENRTKELVFANEQLEKSMEDLKITQEKLVESQKQLTMISLVKWIAHHMNTPLGNIVSTLSFINSMDLSTSKNEDSVKEVLDLLDRNVKKLVDIISSLKRITLSSEEMVFEEVDLCELINNSINQYVKLYGIKNLEIETECKSYVTPIRTYKNILMQVILILLENVEKHAYYENDKKFVKLEVFQENQITYIKVIDFGKGISKIKRDRIFESFFEKISGDFVPELGIKIAYNQVIGALGGKLLYDESVPKGTTFIIELPSRNMKKQGALTDGENNHN